MKNLAEHWESNGVYVKPVSDEAAVQEVFKFRYAVYVKERGVPLKYADHNAQTLREPLDDHSFQVGAYDRQHKLVGAGRMTFSNQCPNGNIPYLRNYFQFDKVLGPRPVCHGLVTKLAVAREHRGTDLAFGLCKAMLDLSYAAGAEYMFVDVGRRVLPFMGRLGFHAYKGYDIHPEFGPSIPMYLSLHELDHLRTVRSPLFNIARRNTQQRAKIMKQTIHDEFMKILQQTHASPGFQRILTRDIGIDHYASFMRQVFHYARLNPKIQALATVYFRGDEHATTQRYFRHAASEIGHDTMALNDLKFLGYETDSVPFEKPLAETTALIAYPFYQIEHVNSLGHLGYMYFLENLATTDSEKFVVAFREIGVPDGAMSFIAEHITVDVHHTKMLELYIDTMVKSKTDADEVIYGIQTTAKLYDLMLSAAFRAVDESYDYTRFLDPSAQSLETA